MLNSVDTTTLMLGGLLVGALPSAMLAFMGWLLMRAVRGVDDSLANLNKKVDQLAAKDTETLLALEMLRSRITRLEFQVFGRKSREE